jgi:hypothetical protein
MRAARRDRRLQWVAPRAGPWWDHSVCLAYQGRFPFRLFPREALVTETLTTARTRGLAPALRVTGRRLEMCGHAAAHRRAPHRLLVAWPALITHGELGYLATGTDWDVVAAGTEAWARERF